MAVQEGFGRLPGIGLHEPDVRKGQDLAEEGDLFAPTLQRHHRLDEVDLGMARRMMQRNEGRVRRLPPGPDIVLHDGVAAGEPVLVPQLAKVSLLIVDLCEAPSYVLHVHLNGDCGSPRVARSTNLSSACLTPG